MKITRLAAAAAVVTAALGVTALASPASAAALPTANSSGAYGNPARYVPFMAAQQTGDCVEQSALLAMAAITGTWPASHAGIDEYAAKAGIGFKGVKTATDPGPADGGPIINGSYVTAQLFEHYGFTATAPKATSRPTLEKALAAGDSVQVTVYAGDLWGTATTPGADPALGVYDGDSTPNPDHAVVVESINKTTNAVTIGDTGVGRSYTITWAQFSAAWATGDYSAVIVSKAVAHPLAH